MDVLTIIRVLLKLRELRRHDKWSKNEISEFQKKSLLLSRKFAVSNSPFYRKFHQGLENAPFHELPVLTKKMMMENFDEFVTDRKIHLEDVRKHVLGGCVGKFNGIYEVVATSGSTGSPGIFLFNPEEWATLIASFARAREWANMKIDLLKRSKMAIVTSKNDRNLSARVGKVANTPFIPTLRIDSTEEIENIVSKLNRFKPEVFVAYASMAFFLALQQKEGRLHINPKKIFVSAEVLTEEMRKQIQEVWGNIVFDEYASTETATISAEDEKHHGSHVFEDLLTLENVDENNKAVPLGEFGEKLLVTTLFSRTQPLIRYEISDSVRFSTKQPECELPFVVTSGVQGRREDFLTIDGKQIHPNVFHDLMDDIENNGWRIVQEKDFLRVLLVQPKATSQEIENQMRNALFKKGINLQVKVEKVGEIPKGKGGKSPLIRAYV